LALPLPGLKHQKVAAELREKLLKEELKGRSKKHLVQSHVFSEKLKPIRNVQGGFANITAWWELPRSPSLLRGRPRPQESGPLDWERRRSFYMEGRGRSPYNCNMLSNTTYHNRAISMMQMIDELIKLAKGLDAATRCASPVQEHQVRVASA
jgi:hypothetical protein